MWLGSADSSGVTGQVFEARTLVTGGSCGRMLYGDKVQQAEQAR